MRFADNRCPSCGAYDWHDNHAKPPHGRLGRKHVICGCGFEAQATANRIFTTTRSGSGKTAMLHIRVTPATKERYEQAVSGICTGETIVSLGLDSLGDCSTIAV